MSWWNILSMKPEDAKKSMEHYNKKAGVFKCPACSKEHSIYEECEKA